MKKAFTFTEIMLALAIIGFITVIVLPIFFNTYGNKVTAAQLKKVCTQITNATKHIMVDDRSRDFASLNSDINTNVAEDDEGNVVTLGFYYSRGGVKTSTEEQGAQYFLENYFRHTKTNCGTGGTSECVAALYHAADDNKTPLGTFPADFYCIRNTSDSTICMRYNENICMRYDKDNNACERTGATEVLVDVNGATRPNVAGSDVFTMYITNDGQLRDLDENDANCNVQSGIAEEDIIRYSAGCFHKIVSRSWNMREDQ